MVLVVTSHLTPVWTTLMRISGVRQVKAVSLRYPIAICSLHCNRAINSIYTWIISTGSAYVKLDRIKVSLFWLDIYRRIKESVGLDVYKCVTSGSTCSNSNYFCSGYPAHAYNYYFQQYDQCLGLYIQSNTSTCLRDSTCPNVAAFICELCKFDLSVERSLFLFTLDWNRCMREKRNLFWINLDCARKSVVLNWWRILWAHASSSTNVFQNTEGLCGHHALAFERFSMATSYSSCVRWMSLDYYCNTGKKSTANSQLQNTQWQWKVQNKHEGEKRMIQERIIRIVRRKADNSFQWRMAFERHLLFDVSLCCVHRHWETIANVHCDTNTRSVHRWNWRERWISIGADKRPSVDNERKLRARNSSSRAISNSALAPSPEFSLARFESAFSISLDSGKDDRRRSVSIEYKECLENQRSSFDFSVWPD